MPLSRQALDARLELRVAQLRVLAAWTFVQASRAAGLPAGLCVTQLLAPDRGAMLPRLARGWAATGTAGPLREN